MEKRSFDKELFINMRQLILYASFLMCPPLEKAPAHKVSEINKPPGGLMFRVYNIGS